VLEGGGSPGGGMVCCNWPVWSCRFHLAMSCESPVVWSCTANVVV